MGILRRTSTCQRVLKTPGSSKYSSTQDTQPVLNSQTVLSSQKKKKTVLCYLQTKTGQLQDSSVSTASSGNKRQIH